MTKKQTNVMVGYSGEMTDVLKDVLQDNLSPEAVAAIAGLIESVTVGGTVGKEVKWFRQLLIDMLGGPDEHWRLWEQLEIR